MLPPVSPAPLHTQPAPSSSTSVLSSTPHGAKHVDLQRSLIHTRAPQLRLPRRSPQNAPPHSFLSFPFLSSSFRWLPGVRSSHSGCSAHSHGARSSECVSVSVLDLFVVVELFFLLEMPAPPSARDPPAVPPSAGTACYFYYTQTTSPLLLDFRHLASHTGGRYIDSQVATSTQTEIHQQISRSATDTQQRRRRR